MFPFIFHFKKDFFPWTFSGNRKQVLKDKVSKWQDCISRDFYFKDFFPQDFFVSKFRTLLPTNFFQKTFLGGYHNCTLFIFINFHYRFLGLFFGIVLGLFWDCFGIVLGLFFGIVFWDYHPQLHPWNLYLINMWKITSLFLARKVFNSDKSYIVFLIYFWSDKALKETVVNRKCHNYLKFGLKAQ